MPDLEAPTPRAQLTTEDRNIKAGAPQQEGFESRKDLMRAYKRTFQELLQDPVIQKLMEHCAKNDTNILCTPTWRITQDREVAWRPMTLVWERAIGLTRSGFRGVERYAGREFGDLLKSDFDENRPFEDRGLLGGRLLSLSFKRMMKLGVEPESIKNMLYEAAERVKGKEEQ